MKLNVRRAAAAFALAAAAVTGIGAGVASADNGSTWGDMTHGNKTVPTTHAPSTNDLPWWVGKPGHHHGSRPRH